MNEQIVVTCELCIVGAGYAGINAFNAASKYLPKGSCVVVVDRGEAWGGQWTGQYDFVRLHQPYEVFTAGERSWEIKKPTGYLATKKEILSHFESIAEACIQDRSLDLVTLFEYEYDEHIVRNGNVEMHVRSLKMLPTIKIVAKKLINASGLDIKLLQPFLFSTTEEFHSLCPADVLTPKWNVMMRYSADKEKTIWVIGSGKTAMDVIYHLCKNIPNVASRIRCISGRGMWFMVRDVLFPNSWWKRNIYGSKMGPEYLIDMVEMFDGNNQKEIYREMEQQGFFHSAIDNPENFLLGIISLEEMNVIKSALTPATEKVIKAHLVDIVDGGRFKLRALDGKTFFFEDVEPGSFIVNCTDHLTEDNNHFSPIVSDDGLVLTTQMALGFPGPTANHLTHAFYLGTLDSVWRKLPRVVYDASNKYEAGLYMVMVLLISKLQILPALPSKVLLENKQDPVTWYPFHRRLFLVIRIWFMKDRMIKKSKKLLKLRFSDKTQYIMEKKSILAGNIGLSSKL